MTAGFGAALRSRTMWFVSMASVLLAVLAGPVAAPAAEAVEMSAVDVVKTANLADFRAGNIVSDAVFFDQGTMTEAQIQTFLESKVPKCQSGYTCLKDWYDTSRTTTADPMCGAYSGGVRERASRIIYKVARACGINPQVLIVTLQKEQGLVTHTWPSEWRFRIAMGQGCPDTAGCDTRYYGFFNQVYGAAWQFKRYANPPGTSQFFTWYAPGKTWNILYNPNRDCGSSPVFVQNQATANLYYYTPYQPNAAALRAGYGIGDSCSAYGNRNFYNYFTDWFGSTIVPADACREPSAVSPAAKVYVVTASVLNARLAPSTLCTKSIVQLPQGTVLQATAVSGDWLRVDTESGGRWVAREYLRYATTDESACALPPKAGAAQYAYVLTADAQARLVPDSACGADARTVAQGTIVRAFLVSADNAWVKVHLGDVDRWMARSTLTRASDTEAACALPGGVTSAANHYIVADGGATGREVPDPACTRTAAAISGGVVVKAVAANADRDWLKVSTGRGEVWIDRDRLRTVSAGSACTVMPEIRSTPRSYVVLDGAMARSAPSTACADGTVVPTAGLVFQPTAVTAAGDWLQISLPDGLRWLPRTAVRAPTMEELCTPPGVRSASRSYVVLGAQSTYAGPNAACGAVGTVAAGALVTAVEASADTTWIRLGTTDGGAWVPRSSLRYATQAEACAQPADAGPASLTYVVGAAGTTARTGPRTGCSLGALQIAPGTVAVAVAITAQRDWLKLKLPSGELWVPRADVSRAVAP